MGAKRKASNKPANGWPLRLLRIAGLSIIGAIILSVGWVASVGFHDPSGTRLMDIRKADGAEITKTWLSLDRVSPHLIRAVIAAEDSRFCEHHGFDFEAIKKAVDEAGDGGQRRGASTISQQVAKNVFLWPGRNYVRKGLEVWFTAWAELLWSKQRVMEVYLNVAEWGDGVFGAEAAAQAHFGKSAARLTRREAALLAAILPSPRKWRANPAGPYVRRRASTLEQRMRIVEREGLDRCALPHG